jgi:hypothetical protein
VSRIRKGEEGSSEGSARIVPAQAAGHPETDVCGLKLSSDENSINIQNQLFV